jgi:hypothetical protein
MKKISQSKTMWFSFALALAGAIEIYYPYLQNNIKPEFYGPIFMVIGVISATLRFITTERIK